MSHYPNHYALRKKTTQKFACYLRLPIPYDQEFRDDSTITLFVARKLAASKQDEPSLSVSAADNLAVCIHITRAGNPADMF
jgi:hypothetical protein